MSTGKRIAFQDSELEHAYFLQSREQVREKGEVWGNLNIGKPTLLSFAGVYPRVKRRAQDRLRLDTRNDALVIFFSLNDIWQLTKKK